MDYITKKEIFVKRLEGALLGYGKNKHFLPIKISILFLRMHGFKDEMLRHLQREDIESLPIGLIVQMCHGQANSIYDAKEITSKIDAILQAEDEREKIHLKMKILNKYKCLRRVKCPSIMAL